MSFLQLCQATYRYHQRASEHQLKHQDYEEWLEGLPGNMARDMAAKGFKEAFRVGPTNTVCTGKTWLSSSNALMWERKIKFGK